MKVGVSFHKLSQPRKGHLQEESFLKVSYQGKCPEAKVTYPLIESFPLEF